MHQLLPREVIRNNDHQLCRANKGSLYNNPAHGTCQMHVVQTAQVSHIYQGCSRNQASFSVRNLQSFRFFFGNSGPTHQNNILEGNQNPEPKITGTHLIQRFTLHLSNQCLFIHITSMHSTSTKTTTTKHHGIKICHSITMSAPSDAVTVPTNSDDNDTKHTFSQYLAL